MGHILLSFLFYNVILILFYNHYKRGHIYIKKSNLIIYTIVLIAFGTYGGGEGDYVHYKEIVESFHSLFEVTYFNGMEIQYNYLAYLLDGNYNLWRFVVFSIQFIGMSWFLYKSKLNTYPIFLCFISLCLVQSVYNRSFWGTIYFYMGIYLLLEKKNPLYLIAVALCYVSHTQNLVLLVLLPLAFIDIKKWQLFIMLILIGTIGAMVKDTFTQILDTGGIEGADYVNDRMNIYSQSELGNFGNSIGEYILFMLRYVPMAIIILQWIILILKNQRKYLLFYKPYRRVLNITVGVVIASFSVLLASLGGGTFYYRILAMTLFPFSIIFPYMLKNNSITKHRFECYIMLFIIATEFSYIKDVYYAYANGNF